MNETLDTLMSPWSADPPKDPPPQTGTDTAKGDRSTKVKPKK